MSVRESLFVTHGARLCLTINSTLSDMSKAKEAKIFLWIPRNLNKLYIVFLKVD